MNEVPPPSQRITQKADPVLMPRFGLFRETLPAKDDAYVDPCPECCVGKHGNCNGQALDHVRDDIVQCPCSALGHA